MQVELVVSQEILDESANDFQEVDSCPIARVLKNFIKNGVTFWVGYNGISLWESFSRDELFIPFSREVPDVYKSNAGSPGIDENGNLYTDLIPFSTFIDIPEQYLALAIA